MIAYVFQKYPGNFAFQLQSNLSIADMLYSGHLFRGTGGIRVKLSYKNPYIADTFIVDTIFWHRVKSSSQIYVFIADTPYFYGKIKINCYSTFKCLYLTTFSVFTSNELSTFSKGFLSQFVTPGSS